MPGANDASARKCRATARENKRMCSELQRQRAELKAYPDIIHRQANDFAKAISQSWREAAAYGDNRVSEARKERAGEIAALRAELERTKAELEQSRASLLKHEEAKEEMAFPAASAPSSRKRTRGTK